MKKYYLPILLILAILILRSLPHPANLAPVSAVALISAIYLTGNKRWLIPMLGLFLSDIFIGFYHPAVMLAVYGSIAAIFGIGILVRRSKSISTIVIGTLLSSLIFFGVTNFAVWISADWYPKTLEGLQLAYLLAIPFFKNTLIGDILYTAIFAGIMEVAIMWQSRRLPAIKKSEV